MYHDLVEPKAEDSSGFPGGDASSYKMPATQFERHLAAIAQRMAQTTPGAWPIMTFDDGGCSAMTAADHLERAGQRGHFFITTNYIGRAGFLDRHSIRELAERGHVIGTHSASHPLRMGHCSRTQLSIEWARSASILADIVGAPIRAASLPGGDYHERVAETAASAGLTVLFTSEPSCQPRNEGGLMLVGRFTMRRHTSPEMAASLAAGDVFPRLRQHLEWNLRKASKTMGGRRYLQVRRRILGYGPVVWGDAEAAPPGGRKR
jgi:peptidoglycan/xylan/chitin deacetylase (PgdA/CDA1 family)